MKRALGRSIAIVGATLTAAAVSVAPAVAKRAGCGRFCRQGGAVGAIGPHDPGVTIRGADRSLRLRQGFVTVRVTCRRTTACVGAVEIEPGFFPLPGGVPGGTYNGVDLRVGAGQTASFDIPLLPAAAQLVRQRERLLVDVLVRLDDNELTEVDRKMTISPA